MLGGSIHAPHLGLSGSTPAAARSFAELLGMGGPVWPLFCIARAPLPFRQAPGRGRRAYVCARASQHAAMARLRPHGAAPPPTTLPLAPALPCRLLFPVLLAQSAVLALQAPHMCTSPGLQQAYALLHRGLLRAARRTHLLPPGAPPAAAPAAAAVESLCSIYQPAFIVLGNALLGYAAFCAELHQRRAFVEQRSAAAGSQRRLLAALHRRGRLPVQPADYWLQFSLPAACALAFLHLPMKGLPPRTAGVSSN